MNTHYCMFSGHILLVLEKWKNLSVKIAKLKAKYFKTCNNFTSKWPQMVHLLHKCDKFVLKSYIANRERRLNGSKLKQKDNEAVTPHTRIQRFSALVAKFTMQNQPWYDADDSKNSGSNSDSGEDLTNESDPEIILEQTYHHICLVTCSYINTY